MTFDNERLEPNGMYAVFLFNRFNVSLARKHNSLMPSGTCNNSNVEISKGYKRPRNSHKYGHETFFFPAEMSKSKKMMHRCV